MVAIIPGGKLSEENWVYCLILLTVYTVLPVLNDILTDSSHLQSQGEDSSAGKGTGLVTLMPGVRILSLS